MGRRELRAELEATWTVLEPLTPGKPMTRADRDAALTPEQASEMRARIRAEQAPVSLRGLARRQRVR